MARRCPHCGRRFGGRPSFCAHDGHGLEPDPLADRVFDGRRIVRFLGEGAMGAVYRVRSDDRDHDEALKILLARDPEAIRRFQQEIRIVSKLTSEHTLRLHGHGRTPDDYLFLITEFVRGFTVDEVLARVDRLSPRRAARIVHQVCASLVEAHALDVVHRDLKPGNLMLEVRGDVEFVRVLDFGVARLRGEAGIRTAEGRIFGTPAYCSPEQAIGAPDLDGRSDLYALGVVFYEMLTGHNPFIADDALNTLRRHLEHHPTPPEGPPDLVGLVMQLLAKKREDRPQSAAEVRKRLEAISGVVVKRAAPSAASDLAEARSRLDASLREAERLEREARGRAKELARREATLAEATARQRQALEEARAALDTGWARLQGDVVEALANLDEALDHD
ncbi:MAG: protein kinase [Myxococcales bacterium]|nr:protein kinase [Myxococcales bacterium]